MSDEANVVEDNEEFVQYSCHPIRKLSFGREFRFENGVMRLRPDQVEAFEKVLEGADARTRYQVKKIDATLAESIVRSLLISGATKSIDSVAGGDTARATEVGTQAIDKPVEEPVEEEKPAAPLSGGLNLSLGGK